MLRERLQRWLTVDTRTLGLFRIGFGVLLLTNLYDRMGGADLVNFYTNDGIWPNHYALFRPPTHGYWSPLLGFSTPSEMQVMGLLIAAVYIAYTVGYRTRLMQVLALLCLEAVNFRFLLIQHGGNVVMNVLAVWTLFLPLGERFSLDALFRSLRESDDADLASLRERAWHRLRVPQVTAIAFGCVLFNFAAIYFFNALHKSGHSWHEGSAVHWVLWQNRLATSFAGWVRMHEPFWLSPAMTWGTLAMEWSLPVLLLSWWRSELLRPIAFAMILALHGGIAALCTLGPFSYSMMAFGLLLVTPRVWERLKTRLTKTRTSLRLQFDRNSPRQWLAVRVLARLDWAKSLDFEQVDGFQPGPDDASRALRSLVGLRGLAGVFAFPLVRPVAWATLRAVLTVGVDALAARPPARPVPLFERIGGWVKLAAPLLILSAVVSQLLMESWGVPQALKPSWRPEFMTAIIDYLQIPQGWSMFAPEAPMADHVLVVDATLADGSHIDPLTEAPPDFERPMHGPYGFNQHWCEVHGRMPTWPQHWDWFREYLKRRPEALGWPPERRIVSLEVWKVSAEAPLMGETVPRNLRRERLFAAGPFP